MKKYKYILSIVGITLLAVILTIAIELFISTRGPRLSEFANPDQQVRVLGSGEKITYVVLGDSTTAGLGGDYEQGIAITTAKFLAENKSKEVSMTNFSVSGDRVQDVLNNQLSEALKLNPDVILMVAGSNDVTRLTDLKSIESDLKAIVAKIKASNKNTKIILSGSGDVGASPRFLQPLKSLIDLRTGQINQVFEEFLEANPEIVYAPVAETGHIFRRDESLFSEDRYHPNTEGYKLWSESINKRLKDIEI